MRKAVKQETFPGNYYVLSSINSSSQSNCAGKGVVY